MQKKILIYLSKSTKSVHIFFGKCLRSLRYIAKKTLPTFGAKLTTPVDHLIVDVNDAPDRKVNGN